MCIVFGWIHFRTDFGVFALILTKLKRTRRIQNPRNPKQRMLYFHIFVRNAIKCRQMPFNTIECRWFYHIPFSATECHQIALTRLDCGQQFRSSWSFQKPCHSFVDMWVRHSKVIKLAYSEHGCRFSYRVACKRKFSEFGSKMGPYIIIKQINK